MPGLASPPRVTCRRQPLLSSMHGVSVHGEWALGRLPSAILWPRAFDRMGFQADERVYINFVFEHKPQKQKKSEGEPNSTLSSARNLSAAGSRISSGLSENILILTWSLNDAIYLTFDLSTRTYGVSENRN